jgi:tetratricopeptide (TPR) repeat protein
MLGNFGDARAILAEARAEFAERGGLELALCIGEASADVEFLAGDTEAAVALKKEGCRQLEQRGEKGYQSSMAASLARMLCELDRLDEADHWIERARHLGASDDTETQLAWRCARARVLARRRQHSEAARLARDGLQVANATDNLNIQANSYADLAEVLTLAGHTEEARNPLQQALDRYERKGNIVMAQRIRTRLATARVHT